MVQAKYSLDAEEPTEEVASVRAKNVQAANKKRKGKERELPCVEVMTGYGHHRTLGPTLQWNIMILLYSLYSFSFH